MGHQDPPQEPFTLSLDSGGGAGVDAALQGRAHAGSLEPAQSGRPAAEMLDLDRAECLRLLACNGTGRVVVSVAGWDTPVIRPVNYVFDKASESVLIRSEVGSKLYALLHSDKAAFEIDGTDPAGRIGWSVIVMGISEEITKPAELQRIEKLGLEPWAPGQKGHWTRIRSDTVSGRRITPLTDANPDDPGLEH